jgi:alkylation response protein AidB-like acyl-CoA dehydrogenase
MSFGPGADAERLRHVVRDFLRRHSPEHAVRRIAESESGYDPAVWAQAAQELGLPGLVIPERLGGGGATPVELGVVFEDLGDVLFCGPFFATVG